MALSKYHVIAAVQSLALLMAVRMGVAQSATREDPEMLRRSVIQSADPENDTAPDDDAVAKLLDEPLDLNAATVDQLVRLPGVTRRLADLVVTHRQQNGDFATVESVSRVAGVSLSDVELLAPFVLVEPVRTSKRNQFRLRLSHLFQRRLEEAKGFSRDQSDSLSRYLGGPFAWTTRIAVETHSFEASLTADHDRGEPWVWRPSDRRFGADLVSWSLELRPGSILRSIVLGDIRYASRMGLATGSGGIASFEQPARAASYSPPRGHSGASTSELGRGVAVRLDSGPVEITAIISHRRRDARTEIAAAGDSVLVLNASNRTHRTDAELARRNSLGQRFAGVRIGLQGRRTAVGVFAQHTSFDKAIAHTNRPDQLFAFEGQSQSIVGVDFSWHAGRTRCAAEMNVPKQAKSLAFTSLSGAVYCEVSAGRSYRVWTYVRVLPLSSGSLAGTPLSRGSRPSGGEQGISFGVRSRPMRGVTLTIYTDLWRYRWLRFNLWRPTGGREMGARLTRRTKLANISIKVSEVSKEAGITSIDHAGRSLRSAERMTRTSASFSSTWWFSSRFGWVLSCDVRRARGHQLPSAVGAMMSVGVRFRHSRLQSAAGVTLFDSPSVATRIFGYEPTMRFGFGAISYTGSGERWYVLLSATVAPAVLIQMKYSSTYRYGARTVGSGLEEVKGNRLQDVGIQIVVNTSTKS